MLLNIAYIDDEIELLDMFSDLFTTAKVKVTTFSKHLELVDFVKTNKIDLVFMDFRMPHITGDQVALMLPLEIPKILITGDLTVKLEANFLEILKKPINSTEVRNIIAKYSK